MEQAPAQQLPEYWYVLSDFDKYQYAMLRAQLSAQATKNQRFKRVENFTETIEKIRMFCCRGQNDDWRRCLVCGICWLQEGLAINTRQLRLLIFKCKSSINGSLQKMGFSVSLGRSESTNALVLAFPILKDNINELRQWTVRKCGNQCVSPISPPMPINYNQNQTEIPMINVTAPTPAKKVTPLPIPCINLVTKPTENSYSEENNCDPEYDNSFYQHNFACEDDFYQIDIED